MIKKNRFEFMNEVKAQNVRNMEFIYKELDMTE